MKKILRTIILMTLITLVCVSSVTVAFAEANIPSATSDFYVNDFAGVFTEAEKTKLMTNAVSLANEHNGIQVVVTTVKTLEGDTVENYAYRMYNQYGIGKDDMGLLILLATEDRQIRVEVGRAMEGYVNDAKAGRFMDKYAIPYLRENKFNEGLISLQEAFITEIKSCVTSAGATENTPGVDINIDWGAVLFTILIIAVAGGIGFLVIFVVNKLKKKKQERKEYIEGLNNKIASLNTSVETLQKVNGYLNRERDNLQSKLDYANESLQKLESQHKRILMVYPDADKKVDEMIKAEKIAKDKLAAKKVDNLIESVINLTPDKDLFDRLASIQQRIDSLNYDEARYLQADMSRFNVLYSQCDKLKREYDRKVEEERRRKLTEQRKEKAKNITNKLLRVIAAVGIVGSNDLSSLKEAKSLYENLDTETRSYVDTTAISKIEDLLRRAKQIKQDEEDEERRRREAQSYSTSSYSSSSHSGFGGFGGRSGGGGASRGF